MLNQLQKRSLRHRLEEERTRLVAVVQQLDAEADAFRGAAVTGPTAVGDYSSEDGIETFEPERVRRMEEIERSILTLVDGALARLERGEYGQCVRCHQAIVPDRLEAIPHTPYCLACESIIEDQGRS